MGKRVTLKLLSIISLILAPFIGGYGIYHLTLLDDINDSLEINTGLLSFGILGVFELFRAGMTAVMYAVTLMAGAVCIWNALCMVILGTLCLIALKRQSLKLITVLMWVTRVLIAIALLIVVIPSLLLFDSFYVMAMSFLGMGLMIITLRVFESLLSQERKAMLAPLPEEAPDEDE